MIAVGRISGCVPGGKSGGKGSCRVSSWISGCGSSGVPSRIPNCGPNRIPGRISTNVIVVYTIIILGSLLFCNFLSVGPQTLKFTGRSGKMREW